MKSIAAVFLTGLFMLLGIFLFSHLGYALEDTTAKDQVILVADASILHGLPLKYPETAVVKDGSQKRPGILQVPYGEVEAYIEILQKERGIIRILPAQGPPALSFTRYLTSMQETLEAYGQGNFGQLFSRSAGLFPLTDKLGLMVQRTSFYLFIGLAFAIAAGTIGALIASFKPVLGKILDSLHTLLLALPDFLVVVLLQMLCILLSQLLDRPAYLIVEYSGSVPFLIPFATVALVPGALVYGTLRIAIRRELAEDYVITAKAKGISHIGVVIRHILRNILEDLFAVLPKAASLAVGAVVVAEVLCQIFAMGGIVRNPVFSIGSLSALSTLCMTLGLLMLAFNLFLAVLKKILHIGRRGSEVTL